MGLHLKLKRDNDLYRILELYDNLLEDLKNTFNMILFKEDTFKLIESKHSERIIWEGKVFDKELVLNLIKEDIKTVIGEKSYTLTKDGVLYLKRENELGSIIIDINAYYLNSDSVLYGDVYVDFYDSDIKWEDNFFGDNSDSIDNFNLMGFMGNSLKEKFDLKYAFIGTYENFQRKILSNTKN